MSNEKLSRRLQTNYSLAGSVAVFMSGNESLGMGGLWVVEVIFHQFSFESAVVINRTTVMVLIGICRQPENPSTQFSTCSKQRI